MSDSFKPQPWLSPVEAQRPVSINTNIVLPGDASEGDAKVLSGVAGEIVDGNQGTLDRFIANNRQQHSLNSQAYMDKFAALDGMTVRHRVNSGYETIDLDVRPFGGGDSPFTKADVNLDGYMVWVHAEPEYGGTIGGRTVKCGPFAIVMNGYKIEDNYDPIMAGGHTGGYVFVFGKTALLGPSLAQDLDRANPLIGDTHFKPPLKLVPAPGWGQDIGGALDGGLLDKQPRELGYWVFDWLSPYNPAQYLNRRPVFSFTDDYRSWTQFFAGFSNHSLGDLTLDRGIYFPDTRKSILNPTGVNGVQVFSLSPATPASQVIDLWYGEFFDRGKFRVVRQSWQVAPKPRQIVKANDFPNRYLVSTIQNVEGNYHGYTADFDLSAKFSNDPANLNNGPNNNHMSTLGPAGSDASVTPAQQAILDAWRAYNVRVLQDFARAEAPILTRLLKAITDMAGQVAQAHKLAFLMRAYTGDYTLYSDPTRFPNDAQWYTPPGSTTPLTHGTPRGPLAQPFVESEVVVRTYAEDPGNPGHYFQTGQMISQSGPNQDYFIDVTDNQDLSNYQTNAATILVNSGINARYDQTGVISDITTGSPASGSTTETTTYSYFDNGVPSDSAHDKIIGPSHDLSGLEILAGAFINTTMDDYTAAVAAYNLELAKQPPGLQPFPNIGDDLSKFVYDYITIDGTQWSYRQ